MPGVKKFAGVPQENSGISNKNRVKFSTPRSAEPEDAGDYTSPMPSTAPVPASPTSSPAVSTRKRIGIHTSVAGGMHLAAQRAYDNGCSALQIFSSSPRQWRAAKPSELECSEMRRLRAELDLKPLVIHVNYLVNLASVKDEVYSKSIAAFRGEVERALALGAEHLVLHSGSFNGSTREEGLAKVVAGITQATEGLDLAAGGLSVLIENTAGAEFSLGSKFEQVAELVNRLTPVIPVGACIDTCHTHVAGYEITTKSGLAATLALLDATVGLKRIPVWHCNDAKAPFGSKLDRHEHIGQGTIGLEPFSWLLNDPQLSHAAFIAETPVDEEGDERRNVQALTGLVG